MTIPSWFMIVSGIVIAGVSFYIGEKFQLFFYIGLIFLAYGLVKLFVLRGKLHSVATEARKQTYQEPQVAKSKYLYCMHCGSIVHATDTFCYKCGHRLKP
ncbi:zinc ribbon domain-containing protein [Candidatus Woesearchaeota archaeon]|nr:zinc ribbon domain-containing protein [Candidatus Woesearchaeota archaeon]